MSRVTTATAPSDRLPSGADAASRQSWSDLSSSDSRFAQARVERIVAIVIALGCAVLGVQAFLNALGSTQEPPEWHIVLMVMAFAPLVLMVIALVVGFAERVASGICAVMLVVVFVCWPFAVGPVADPHAGHPWIWYLLNVATAATVMAAGFGWQVVCAIVVPLIYIAVRFAQTGITPTTAVDVVLGAAFSAILAGVIVAIAAMLRTLARGLDTARTDAVASYAAAAEAEAVETERVAVAALMHDSVLAALIAAERARTPREDSLAVAMAQEALTRLANAEEDGREGPEEPVTVASVVEEIEQASARLGAPLTVAAPEAARTHEVPGRVARAIVLATTQSVANAIEHANARGLSVTMDADAGQLAVRISDTGPGFVPAEVPPDRLGIRGSIVARLAAAGGRARVQTSPDGTVVELRWQARE